MQKQILILSDSAIGDFANAISKVLIKNLTPLIIESFKYPVSPPKTERFLTRRETAKRIGISLPTLHKYTTNGRIKAYRIARQVRYKESDIASSLLRIEAG